MHSLQFSSYLLFSTLLTAAQVACVSRIVTENWESLSNLSTTRHQFVREKRIVGGVHVDERDYPWSVSVQVNNDMGYFSYFKWTYHHLCGGVFIHPEWILTAAHCVIDTYAENPKFKDLSLWRVRIGSLYKDATFWESVKGWLSAGYNYVFGHTKLEPYYGVKNIIVHEHYDPLSLDIGQDIALLKLDHRIYDSGIPDFHAIRLPELRVLGDWPKPGVTCTAVGWGCYNYGEGSVPLLNAVKLPIMSNSECSKVFIHGSAAYELCAGQFGRGKGPCSGDSGGALVCPGVYGSETLAGIASYGVPGNPGEFPAVFTRISNYTDWIVSVIRYS